MYVCLCLAVRPSTRTTRLPLDGFSWNLILVYFFENLSRKFKFHLNLTSIKGTLHEDRYILVFLTISRGTLLRMRNVSDKFVQNIEQILCSTTPSENHAIYEIMCKNMVQPDRSQTMMWHMSIACWVTKDVNTNNVQYSFISTATIVAWMRLSVTWYVHCPVSINLRFSSLVVCAKVKTSCK